MSSLLSLFLFLLPLLHHNTCSNSLFFKIQPTVQEHEELVLLARNLKLKLIEYSWQLYGGGDDDDDYDDDDGDDDAGGSDSTSSRQQRRRHFR